MSYSYFYFFFFFNDTATTEIYTLSLHDALPICAASRGRPSCSTPTTSSRSCARAAGTPASRRSSETGSATSRRSEEHTSELQSRQYLVCRLLLEKKKNNNITHDVSVFRHNSVTI